MTGRQWFLGFASVAWLTLAVMAIPGCGNPDEGTVIVSPEARARLRGTPKDEPPRKGKTKATIDVREKLRKPTEP